MPVTTIKSEEQQHQAEASADCDCERPIPQERAEQRGAARTYCARSGRPVPLRWER